MGSGLQQRGDTQGNGGITLKGGNHVVLVILHAGSDGLGLLELGIQLDVVHADPAALDAAPLEAIDGGNFGNIHASAHTGHADQGVGGAGSGADVHASGAVDHGAAHAVDGLAASGGAGGSDIAQVDPALIDQTPGGAVHGFFPQDDHGGAGSQSCNLGVVGAGSGADIQPHGAADHGGAAGRDGGAVSGLLNLLQLHIAHADPALIDTAPGRAVSSGLLVNGDSGTLGQGGDQGVAHAGSLPDIHPGCAGDGTGSTGGGAGTRGAGRGSGGIAVIIGVGQKNPALRAVAPLAIVGDHGNGALFAPLHGAQLIRGSIGLLADVHIVIGDGDNLGGNGSGNIF